MKIFKKILKTIAYLGIIGGATALGSIFGAGYGVAAFTLSFFVATPTFFGPSKDKIYNVNAEDEISYSSAETKEHSVLEKNNMVHKTTVNTNETKRYSHSKFAPKSQDVKSRKTIEDELEITM